MLTACFGGGPNTLIFVEVDKTRGTHMPHVTRPSLSEKEMGKRLPAPVNIGFSNHRLLAAFRLCFLGACLPVLSQR